MPSTIQRQYSDLNLSFKAHPVTGDIAKLTGDDAIKRAVRNLILTDHYERPFQPNIGSGVKQSLFELMTVATKHKLKTDVEDCIRNYEPRATLQDVIVAVSPDQNSVVLTIIYETVNSTDPVKVDIFLERLR